MANPYGDIELDARGMRALAHPVRVKVLSELQRHGPSTATLLSPTVGASPSVTSWHLRHLAEHGLVRDAPGAAAAGSAGGRRPRAASGCAPTAPSRARRGGSSSGSSRTSRVTSSATGTATSSPGSRRSGSTSPGAPAPGCS